MKTLYIAVVNDVEVYQSFDQEEFNRNLILYGDQATAITREVEEEPVGIKLNLLAEAGSAVEVLEADGISLNSKG